ncbi:MAG: CAP domain-containing protein [Chloroflexi bacterium]|nr:CAP domain-containing protein [Chloroflexota bacterium]
MPRINALRASKGLPAYAPHASLTAAANNHARWMARSGEIAHYQHDGSGPRTRAAQAGFPSSWVSENIYRGASALTAWSWWLDSPIHYAGLVSPHYDKIGIGSASGARGNTYVLVFGNSTGRLLQAGNQARSAAAAGPPAYVLGLDEVGNIKHQIQPGQDLGTIALIYGYTWDDIPYMLEMNGMSWDDIRLLQPGAVFLVPPKDGTFTPAPTVPAAADTATPAARLTPTPLKPAPTLRPAISPASPAAANAPIRVRALPTKSAEPRLSEAKPIEGASGALQLALLGAAIVLQSAVIGAAAFGLIWRRR